jgi:mevalonate kinase
MLMGEHAVLHGGAAIVCAVDARMRVQLTPRKDARVVIHSALGELDVALADLVAAPPFTFVTAALAAACKDLPGGCTLAISSDFSHDVGLGSTVAAVHAWLGRSPAPPAVFEDALAVVRAVQGAASGADLAAAAYGGVLAYQAASRPILRRLADTLPLTVVNSGSKTPTPDVVRQVDAAWADRLDARVALFARSDAACAIAESAICNADWLALGSALDSGHAVLSELGVSNQGQAPASVTARWASERSPTRGRSHSERCPWPCRQRACL